MPAAEGPQTPTTPFLDPDLKYNIVNMLNSSARQNHRLPLDATRRRRPWPRPPRRRTTPTPTADSDHDHDHDTNNSTSSSVNRGNQTSPTVEDGEKGLATGSGDHDRDDHGDDHDHNTDHEGFSCQPSSSQHNDYIEANLESLQKKCDVFQACLIELYSAENYHLVLSGSNLQLQNICGLMYANGGGTYTTLKEDCSTTERKAIRQDIGKSLKKTLLDKTASPEDSTNPKWKKLRECLGESEEPIDAVCRQKNNSTVLCRDLEVDKLTEDFFNHELEHLHCSCAAINSHSPGANEVADSSPLPLAVRVGVAAGVLGLLLVLVIAVVVLCVRHRKVKRSLKEHRMRYLPSAHADESTIYQEVNDYPQSLEAPYKDREQPVLPHGYQFLGPAPPLPERYVKDVTRSRPNRAPPTEDDHGYMEPLPGSAPAGKTPVQSRLAYNTGPSPQPRGGQGGNMYDLAKHPGDTSPTAAGPPGVMPSRVKPSGVKIPQEGTYFARIDVNRADEDGGYSALARRTVEGGARGSEEKELLNMPPSSGRGESTGADEPKYYVLESENEATERDALTAITQM